MNSKKRSTRPQMSYFLLKISEEQKKEKKVLLHCKSSVNARGLHKMVSRAAVVCPALGYTNVLETKPTMKSCIAASSILRSRLRLRPSGPRRNHGRLQGKATGDNAPKKYFQPTMQFFCIFTFAGRPSLTGVYLGWTSKTFEETSFDNYSSNSCE